MIALATQPSSSRRPPEEVRAFLQRLFASAATEPYFPAMRVGLHHGEAVMRGGSFYGISINIAARVAAYARSSQIRGTEFIAEVAEQQGIGTQSPGIQALHTVKRPIELFALPRCSSEALKVIAPVCRMNVHPNTDY